MHNDVSFPLKITVMYSPCARSVVAKEHVYAKGTTVGQALMHLQQTQQLHFDAQMGMSIWGRRVTQDELLSDGDRLEITRPLQVDPKEARRKRFRLNSR